MPSARARVAVILLALPLAARAEPGDPIQAARRNGPLLIDGRLDEPDWVRNAGFSDFEQRFPEAGATPSERTTVHILYDESHLYVGVFCHDSRPDQIQRPLGRRDSLPPGDSVTIFLDSARDGRTAFVFSVSAAGVLSDGLQSEDDEYSGDWDAVWDGAAAATSDGWSAEFSIPLSVLPFRDDGAPVFGIAVKRVIGRLHEEDYSVHLPRSAHGLLERLQPLLGLDRLEPSSAVELVPYVAGRVTARPQYDDDTRPKPRIVEPSADVGLDFKTSLGRGLTLQGTVNPDFGQVEADQLVQNLTTFETFFPEKRPFFTQGMDLFRPVAPQGRSSPQQMFYSRRIGLTAPILMAAKLSGSLSDTVQIGLVEAFVSGESAGTDEAHPERRYLFSPERPLWFGPRSALPQLAPAPENYLAAVVRWHPDPRLSLGATVTSALMAGPRCTNAESRITDDTIQPLRCDTLAGNAAGLDFALRTLDGEWFVRGQVDGSQSLAGSPERTLPDGTHLRPGALGVGAHAALGRAGGEPWRFEIHWEYESPRLDLNALGYQPTQNEQVGRAILGFVRPEGGGPFHYYDLFLNAEARVTTDGRELSRGAQFQLNADFLLRSFDSFGPYVWAIPDHWDVRQVDQSGVDRGRATTPLAAKSPGSVGLGFWFSTDSSRWLMLDGVGGVSRFFGRSEMATLPWSASVDVTVRPHPRVQTQLSLSYNESIAPMRYVENDGAAAPTDRQFLFATLVSPALSLVLRQLLVLTPRLTMQGYAQLYSSSGRYRHFQVAMAHGGRIGDADLGPVVDDPSTNSSTSAWWSNPDYRGATLDLSIVLRWEYRLGSTLFLVYSRTQSELGYPSGGDAPSPPFTIRPIRLSTGPTTDIVLVKWSYWWTP